jgi:hypothetical protein
VGGIFSQNLGQGNSEDHTMILTQLATNVGLTVSFPLINRAALWELKIFAFNYLFMMCLLGIGGGEEGAEWAVREGVGAGERNDPSLVCTYE